MRKSGVFLFMAAISTCIAFCGVNSVRASADQKTIVYVGGMSAGFTLKTEGAQIIGLCEVISENRVKSPALEAGLKSGDVITKINGIAIESIMMMNEIVNKAQGKPLQFEILRGSERFTREIIAMKDKITERYKIGVLVRDNVSGIGTITYVQKENGRFGALGHAVSNEYHQKLDISNGNVYPCNILNVSKGSRGKAGELRGVFINEKPFGIAEKLCESGIYGQVSEMKLVCDWTTAEVNSDAVKPGNAYIYSTITGNCPQKYEIEIVKIDKMNRENKHYVIKIKDEDLISETGGIVQGMSGSPILQDGKMVGAVTHVFLNDPTRGYGIDIETMIKN